MSARPAVVQSTGRGLAQSRLLACSVTPHAVTFTNSGLIVTLAARLRLPALYPIGSVAPCGGVSHALFPHFRAQQRPMALALPKFAISRSRRLRGWACRTRTQKRQEKLSL